MDRTVYNRMQALQDDHWWFRGRRQVIDRVLADQVHRPADILEVGCGVGGNIAMLRRHGEVAALEPDAASRAYVAQRHAIKVADGRLPEGLPFPADRFDMVCAFDVLEHVVEDQASVTALAKLVRPGGVIVATVPAYGWMWSAHDEAHHHHRRYRLKEAEALFGQAGLSIVKATYFNTLLFPLAAAIRFGKRIAGLKGEDDKMPSAAINGLLARIFGLEAGFVAKGRLPFGLSILIVARRAA